MPVTKLQPTINHSGGFLFPWNVPCQYPSTVVILVSGEAEDFPVKQAAVYSHHSLWIHVSKPSMGILILGLILAIGRFSSIIVLVSRAVYLSTAWPFGRSPGCCHVAVTVYLREKP